ncbi:MAG: hypothetical protein KF726_23890 [Anaerolineae bacterium]|nr:hypothetical protein [Anaerolineae bacterium]
MTDFEQAVSLVDQLSMQERLKIIEHIAATLQEPTQASVSTEGTAMGWGAKLATALRSGEIDTSEWVKMDIENDDPVAWVKGIREQERRDREKRL